MQLTDAQRLDWLRLIRTDGIGPRSFRSLLHRFGNAGAALEALPMLSRKAGRPVTPFARDEAERELAAAARLGVALVAIGESAYPQPLAVTDSAPPLLALRGEPVALAKPGLAVVGSRNASAAGQAFTARIAREVGEAGFVIVSGLARGIDASAHKAALATGTVAVIAGGHDRIYPHTHEGLVRQIIEAGGAVVAEMPMGWEPRGRDFPRRNRIISGLAHGTLIVEAARRSGSLITARYALEQGREVFAVPGSPLDPRAEGTNDLIRQGATLVADAEHVIAVLAPIVASAEPLGTSMDSSSRSASLEEAPDFWDEFEIAGPIDHEAAEPQDDRARLLALLSPTPIPADELTRASGLPVRVVQTLLLELELDGAVERHASGAVSRKARP